MNIISTVDYGKFYIDGTITPIIKLLKGSLYKFKQTDATNQSHPLQFSEIIDGTHNSGGVQYTNGYTYYGTPGSDGEIYFDITNDAPDKLYYYARDHSGMG